MTQEIISFRNEVINPIINDLSKLFDITVGKCGPENSGAQFLGMLGILVGIETIAQFTNPCSDKEFELEAKKYYKKLSKNTSINEAERMNVKKYLTCRFHSSEATDLPVNFIKAYFDPIFSNSKPIKKEPCLAELIWKFRNTQVHSYRPYLSEDKKWRGRINWLYFEPKCKIGIGIAVLDQSMRHGQKEPVFNLTKKQGDYRWLEVTVQVLFVHFIWAIERYINQLSIDPPLYKTFIQNYVRLKQQYLLA